MLLQRREGRTPRLFGVQMARVGRVFEDVAIDFRLSVDSPSLRCTELRPPVVNPRTKAEGAMSARGEAFLHMRSRHAGRDQ